MYWLQVSRGKRVPPKDFVPFLILYPPNKPIQNKGDMTTSNIKIQYCPKCGRTKIYIAFKPETEPRLQCVVCDKPKS